MQAQTQDILFFYLTSAPYSMESDSIDGSAPYSFKLFGFFKSCLTVLPWLIFQVCFLMLRAHSRSTLLTVAILSDIYLYSKALSCFILGSVVSFVDGMLYEIFWVHLYLIKSHTMSVNTFFVDSSPGWWAFRWFIFLV